VHDRFGSPIDPTVGYARGDILSSPEREVEKLRFGRRLVRERVERFGPDGIFDCTGLPRAWPLLAGDLPKLESQLTFYTFGRGVLHGAGAARAGGRGGVALAAGRFALASIDPASS
jgi:L-seryl-tRNA(Ser) seleniumtransferase